MRIELDQVSLSYQAGTPMEAVALAGVSMSVEPGERLGIAGPAGSGKSTLLGVMAGILRPDGGRAIHDGKPLTGKKQPEPGRVGLGLQSPENCLFEKTVFDDVSFGPRRLGLGGELLGQRVIRSLECVGLDATAFSQRSPFSLSAGEQRRVALAGLIAMDPEVLLLDEPTAYLDPLTRRDLIERLVAMNEQQGKTIVIVGHDMDEMALFAQRMVILDRGLKVVEGPAADLLLDDEALDGYRLEAPATVRLSRRLEQCTGLEITPVLTEEDAEGLLLQMLTEEGGGGR